MFERRTRLTAFILSSIKQENVFHLNKNKNIPTELKATQGSQSGTYRDEGMSVTHWTLDTNIRQGSVPERKKAKIGVKDGSKIGDNAQKEEDDSRGVQKSSPEDVYRGEEILWISQ